MQYCTNNFYPYIHEHNSLMPSLKWFKFKLISHIITGFSNYIDSILDSNILQTLWQKPEIFDDARQVQGGTSSVKTASHPVETVSISPIGRGRTSKCPSKSMDSISTCTRLKRKNSGQTKNLRGSLSFGSRILKF